MVRTECDARRVCIENEVGVVTIPGAQQLVVDAQLNAIHIPAGAGVDFSHAETPAHDDLIESPDACGRLRIEVMDGAGDRLAIGGLGAYLIAIGTAFSEPRQRHIVGIGRLRIRCRAFPHIREPAVIHPPDRMPVQAPGNVRGGFLDSTGEGAGSNLQLPGRPPLRDKQPVMAVASGLSVETGIGPAPDVQQVAALRHRAPPLRIPAAPTFAPLTVSIAVVTCQKHAAKMPALSVKTCAISRVPRGVNQPLLINGQAETKIITTRPPQPGPLQVAPGIRFDQKRIGAPDALLAVERAAIAADVDGTFRVGRDGMRPLQAGAPPQARPVPRAIQVERKQSGIAGAAEGLPVHRLRRIPRYIHVAVPHRHGMAVIVVGRAPDARPAHLPVRIQRDQCEIPSTRMRGFPVEIGGGIARHIDMPLRVHRNSLASVSFCTSEDARPDIGALCVKDFHKQIAIADGRLPIHILPYLSRYINSPLGTHRHPVRGGVAACRAEDSRPFVRAIITKRQQHAALHPRQHLAVKAAFCRAHDIHPSRRGRHIADLAVLNIPAKPAPSAFIHSLPRCCPCNKQAKYKQDTSWYFHGINPLMMVMRLERSDFGVEKAS